MEILLVVFVFTCIYLVSDLFVQRKTLSIFDPAVCALIVLWKLNSEAGNFHILNVDLNLNVFPPLLLIDLSVFTHKGLSHS